MTTAFNFSAWCGKTLAELPREKNSLIIMVRRSKHILIPNGQTRLTAGDVPGGMGDMY